MFLRSKYANKNGTYFVGIWGLQECYKPLIRVMSAMGVLWECYGCGKGIRPRFEADLSYTFPTV